MRYAVISDVHGNLPGLMAVVEDAKQQGAQQWLFAGDYQSDFHWPNEIVDFLKSRQNARIVKGNREDYLISLLGQDQSAWTDQQFASLYWSYRELTPENLDYLIHLPDEILFDGEGGRKISLFHSLDLFFKNTAAADASLAFYVRQMRAEPVPFDVYLRQRYEALAADPVFMDRLAAHPADILVFGHTHAHWHIEIGGKLLLNAGSCGMPLDFNSNAAYTLLDLTEEGWAVTERRIEYDVEEVIRRLKASPMYAASPYWCHLSILQLRTGEDQVMNTLDHARRLAGEQGVSDSPFPDEILAQAVRHRLASYPKM